jgi:hypothetical protein
MTEYELANELSDARDEIDALKQRIDALERTSEPVPNTMLLDTSFLKRAFAVLGHYMVASLIIALPFYILIFGSLLLLGQI